MSRKNSAIRPSLIHSSSGLAIFEGADLDGDRYFEQAVVQIGKRRVVDDQGQHGGGDQQQAAGGFNGRNERRGYARVRALQIAGLKRAYTLACGDML
jgi:hypothetical protein